MPQDAIRHPWLRYNGYDLHLGTTGTEHRVNFEDFSEQASPGGAGFPGGLGIMVIRGGRCGAAGQRVRQLGGYSGAIAVSPIRARAVLAGIGNVGGDSMNPFQGI
jgi:hypothetical protein